MCVDHEPSCRNLAPADTNARVNALVPALREGEGGKTWEWKRVRGAAWHRVWASMAQGVGIHAFVLLLAFVFHLLKMGGLGPTAGRELKR